MLKGDLTSYQIALYHWSLNEAFKESESGFPVLKTVRNSWIYGLIQHAKTLNSSALRILMSALVKTYHPDATKALAIELTDDEKDHFHRYWDDLRIHGRNYTFAEAEKRLLFPNKINSSKVGKALIRSLRNSLGDAVRSPVPSTWRMETDAYGIKLISQVNRRRNMMDLCHSYINYHINPGLVEGRDHTVLSYPSLCGISKTGWDIYSNDDVDEISISMNLCAQRIISLTEHLHTTGVEIPVWVPPSDWYVP